MWFGDSQLNTIHSADTWGGRQPGLGPLVRDVAIAVASLVVTAVSFFKFEIPVMKRGAKWRPSTVIAIGFGATAACAGLVVLVTTPTDNENAVVIAKTEATRTTLFDKALKQDAEVVSASGHAIPSPGALRSSPC